MQDINKTKKQLIAELEEIRIENKQLKEYFDKSFSNGTKCSNDELLRAVLNASPLPVISFDLNYNVTIWNKAAEKIFGWKEAEIIGMKYPLIPDNQYTEHLEYREKVLKEGSAVGSEVIRKKKDGLLIPVTLSTAVVKDTQGDIIGFMSLFIDLTDKRLSEIKYHTMFDTMAQGVVYQDENGKIININPAAERILGLSLDEIRGLTSYDSRWNSKKEDGSDYPGEEHPASIALNEGREIKNSLMGIFNSKDNEYRWLIVHAIPLFMPGKVKPYQVYSTFEDVTGFRNAIHALRISEQKNRTILNAIPDIIFIYNREGICTSYRAERKSKFHLNPQIFLNKKIDEFVPLHIKEIFYENLHKAFGTDQLQTYIFDMNISGEKLYMEARMIKYEKDEVLILVRDVTDRVILQKKLEDDREELEKLVKERTLSLSRVNKNLAIEIRKQKLYDKQIQESLEKEKELNEMKSRFISMASHEFRTPLTSIRLFTDLIKIYLKNDSDEKVQKYFNRIYAAIENMTEVIKDVLIVSKAETNKLKYEPSNIDLYNFCYRISEENKIYLNEKHNFRFNYNGNINEITADEKLLKQILSNLLSNAIKYSPDGGDIYFDVDLSNTFVTFKIKDEGIGILAKDSKNIFDSFFRGENTGTVPGTGLGLTIVKKSVELQGGTISFNSEPGKGTVFIVIIPLENRT